MTDKKLSLDFEAVNCIYNILTYYMQSEYRTLDEAVNQFSEKRKDEIIKTGLNLDFAVNVVKNIWDDMVNWKFTMPHNGYLKLLQLNPVTIFYDWIMVDEAQDISNCVIDILLHFKKKTILVGDPYQQIYGWNGAVNAIKKFNELGAKKFYLTRSFRCPTYIAALANEYLHLLQAPKNFVGTNTPPDISGPPVVIGRTNTALFDVIFETDPSKTRIFYVGGFDSYEYSSLVDIYYLKKKSAIE
jgi:hypothetical protein